MAPMMFFTSLSALSVMSFVGLSSFLPTQRGPCYGGRRMLAVREGGMPRLLLRLGRSHNITLCWGLYAGVGHLG